MKQYLENIKSTDKLIDELSNAHLNVFHREKSVSINVTGVKKLSPESSFEFYSKTVSKLNESNIELESISFETDFEEDDIYIYESILAFAEETTLKNNIWKFIVQIINDEIHIKCQDLPFKKEMEAKLNDLSNFFTSMNISNKKIFVSEDGDLLGKKSLDELLDKKRERIENEVKEVDVKPWKGYEPVDFAMEDKQPKVYWEGEVFKLDVRKISSGSNIFTFFLGKESQSIQITIFEKEVEVPPFKDGDIIRFHGSYDFDSFSQSYVMKGRLNNYQALSKTSLISIEKDETGLSRSEFHVHTKMSTLDGIGDPSLYVEYAKAYNLKAITITDHNSAQSFPDAHKESGKGVIINYGVELDVYDDLEKDIVINPRDQELLDAEYVFFDLETTSLYPMFDEVIEFGAVKYKNNEVIDKFQTFVKPSKTITKTITRITSITNDDVQFAPSIEEAIRDIHDWIGDAILVAHNAEFDYNFLNKIYKENGYGPIQNPIIDTMKISWLIHPNSRSHTLGQLCKYEEVVYDVEAAHRADYDAEVLSKAYERLLHKLLSEKNIRNLKQLNDCTPLIKDYIFPNHITVVSKNEKGLHDLNKIISMANIDNFNNRRKSASMPLSFFLNNHKHHLLDELLVGSACEKGFVFELMLNSKIEQLETIINIFDYIEVFPIDAYQNLINGEKISEKDLKTLIKEIIKLGEKHNIPVVATSNAHYVSKEQHMYRDILVSAPRVGGKSHPLFNFRDKTAPNPPSHLRTTKEMLEVFGSFLDEKTTMDIVVNNSNKIQSMIEEQKPIKDKLYAPKLPEAEETIVNDIKNTTKELYGDNVDPLIQERIDRELDSIIKHGFAIVYYLSSVAVKKSNEDGFLVGSRGSVGSSIAATLSGITEVNPLKPHYRCPKCKHHEFSDLVDSGFDLPNKKCPKCDFDMVGDGHEIPFETFLGFNADKVPDIDLNFSRDNQSDIHKYMKDFIGEDKVFRAGTISTAAPKTAIGYIKKWQEINEVELSRAQLEWLAGKIQGVKRTTGQHPGGLIVIPETHDVYDFTPINYPGDDSESEWKTTHFDFHSIHDNVLKLDLLGHLDPSSIRMLQNLTGVDPKTIPMNDSQVISLFKSNNALAYKYDYTGESLGIIGLPEFGTNFVRELVREAKPQSFADLIRISGLSHGTNVWSDNAQKLIKSKTATLSEVISTRDDILTYLLDKGVENSTAFNIMESVRKGKGLTSEWELDMKRANVPDWYIDSCKKIEYMFPKAHATAYVMMAFRIAWYKINYPLEYYATFFSKRDVEIELKRVLNGMEDMKRHHSEILAKPKNERVKKDEDTIDTYNIIFEMYSRGIEFSNVDINKSRSVNYEIDKENNKIIPPFSIIDGVGEAVAKAATEARKQGNYTSYTDFKFRSRMPKKVTAALKELGVFKNVIDEREDTEQLTLFV